MLRKFRLTFNSLVTHNLVTITLRFSNSHLSLKASPPHFESTPSGTPWSICTLAEHVTYRSRIVHPVRSNHFFAHHFGVFNCMHFLQLEQGSKRVPQTSLSIRSSRCTSSHSALLAHFLFQIISTQCLLTPITVSPSKVSASVAVSYLQPPTYHPTTLPPPTPWPRTPKP